MKIIKIPQTTSTQDEIINYPIDTILVAKEQTNGRGRFGKSFESGVGGLYFSFRTKYRQDITPFLAVCVANAIKKLCGIDCQIKWVNDILVGGKKLAGILVENKGDYMVCGIGINVYNNPQIPNAISLQQLGVECDLDTLLIYIINEFESGKSWLDTYKKLSIVLGQNIRINGEYIAKVLDILDGGELLLDNGEKLYSGSIEIL